MWIKIWDDKVRHRWECPECDYRVYVSPWFYSENGEPMCIHCPDQETEYIDTEINMQTQVLGSKALRARAAGQF